VQDVGTHVMLSATFGGLTIKARLPSDSAPMKVGDPVWLQVVGAHTCFYKDDEIVA